ncbi:MAG: EAL domain-containing protein [Oxalobacter sp.]|nr:EAL domain-containing protein [Oxalobacter sp.]
MNALLKWLFKIPRLARLLETHQKNEAYLELAFLAYQNSSEAIAVVSAQHTIVAVNPAFEKITGYAESELIGKQTQILNSGHTSPAFYELLWEEISTTGSWRGEMRIKRKNGEDFPAWSAVTAVKDERGEVSLYIVQSMDFSEKKDAENMLWRQANYDSLTGLPNGRLCREWFRHEMLDCLYSGTRLALIGIDLDNFRDVNDAHGYEGGNVLLREAARRISGCIRDIDIAAREAADEFGIILTEIIDVHQVQTTARQLQTLLSEPYDLGSGIVHITASMGITICPDDGADEETLWRNAEHALYTAKEAGKNQVRFFTPAMEALARRRLFLINDMRKAIALQQFELVYQPIAELSSGEIHKAESLLRWHHPTDGIILPAEFIPIAEETGMIIALSNWSFEQVAVQVADWQKRFYPEFQISFNMSAMEFLTDPENSQDRVALMRENGIHGRGIVVEITESMLLQSEVNVNDRLQDFHQAGMEIALDDFGTGYSSLSYLKTFDVDYLKIDQSFVMDMENDSRNMALIEAIIVMGHKLGMKIIAEGVSNEAQMKLLAEAGCDYGQGYLFSEPVSRDQFERLLQEKKPAKKM